MLVFSKVKEKGEGMAFARRGHVVFVFMYFDLLSLSLMSQFLSSAGL